MEKTFVNHITPLLRVCKILGLAYFSIKDTTFLSQAGDFLYPIPVLAFYLINAIKGSNVFGVSFKYI